MIRELAITIPWNSGMKKVGNAGNARCPATTTLGMTSLDLKNADPVFGGHYTHCHFVAVLGLAT